MEKDHQTKKCSIQVDKDIAPIVQYILDNYMFELIPVSSCQENKVEGRAYILLLVRRLTSLDKLIVEIGLKGMLKVEYTAPNVLLLPTFTLSWPVRLTETICKNIK